ncbi:phage virion morphogenesis protein [Acinetobacter junii]|uniref:Phage virion morphogenesis protein n=1 Tax=Acinetobacter junii TaxID=40215 RepID=A0AAW5R5M7_ACIJU|nr:phage virion morphogenesis protein [Acinetobacter junii]MCU4395957.1 phage virion morphogenesis protein [Acinetobacter junii]MDR7653730.1 phage virion morphogenesis protein [Acinetobacter junii]
MSAIQINDQALIDRLHLVASRLFDTSPLAAAIAGTFATVTDDNFDMGGRPEWAGRSAVTLKIYERKGIKYSGVLQASGSLRARVVTSHTQDEAVISNNMPYAAAMHFGIKQGASGKTSRGAPIPFGAIPARPFMPMDAEGNMQSEAEREVFLDVDHYWHKIFNP